MTKKWEQFIEEFDSRPYWRAPAIDNYLEENEFCANLRECLYEKFNPNLFYFDLYIDSADRICVRVEPSEEPISLMTDEVSTEELIHDLDWWLYYAEQPKEIQRVSNQIMQEYNMITKSLSAYLGTWGFIKRN